MHRRAQALLGAGLFALTIGFGTAVAQVGPDEELTPYPHTSIGSGSGGAGYSEEQGGFVMTSSDGDFKLLIGGRLQARFDGIGWDDDLDRDNTATFQIRRARLYFLGHLLGEKNRYFLELGSDSPNVHTQYGETDAHDFELFDAWLKHVHSDAFAFKIGQFRAPFGRQNLINSGKMQLPDRALAVEKLVDDIRDIRDLGIAGSGGFKEGMVQYTVAVTNGDGPNTLNLDDRLAFYGRFVVNPTGDYGYSEGDRHRSEELASTIGFAVNVAENRVGENAVDKTRFNVEGGVKKAGFGIQGEYFYTKLDESNIGEFKTNSYYVQGGYFLNDKLEIAARTSGIYRDGADNDETEFTLGVSCLQMGHRLKWQAAYSYLSEQAPETDNRKNHRFVAQAQLWF